MACCAPSKYCIVADRGHKEGGGEVRVQKCSRGLAHAESLAVQSVMEGLWVAEQPHALPGGRQLSTKRQSGQGWKVDCMCMTDCTGRTWQWAMSQRHFGLTAIACNESAKNQGDKQRARRQDGDASKYNNRQHQTSKHLEMDRHDSAEMQNTYGSISVS